MAQPLKKKNPMNIQNKKTQTYLSKSEIDDIIRQITSGVLDDTLDKSFEEEESMNDT